MNSVDFISFTKAEKLSVVHLFIVMIKGEQLNKKQNQIWDYLSLFELTLDDFEEYMAVTTKDAFESCFRLMEKKKIDILINHIHSFITSEPLAKVMEYFIFIQVFEKITLTPKKYFIEILEDQNKIGFYPELKMLKNS